MFSFRHLKRSLIRKQTIQGLINWGPDRHLSRKINRDRIDDKIFGFRFLISFYGFLNWSHANTLDNRVFMRVACIL